MESTSDRLSQEFHAVGSPHYDLPHYDIVTRGRGGPSKSNLPVCCCTQSQEAIARAFLSPPSPLDGRRNLLATHPATAIPCRLRFKSLPAASEKGRHAAQLPSAFPDSSVVQTLLDVFWVSDFGNPKILAGRGGGVSVIFAPCLKIRMISTQSAFANHSFLTENPIR